MPHFCRKFLGANPRFPERLELFPGLGETEDQVLFLLFLFFCEVGGKIIWLNIEYECQGLAPLTFFGQNRNKSIN